MIDKVHLSSTGARTHAYTRSDDYMYICMHGQAYKALVEKTKDTTGARVENNKFCLSVHFRCVDEKVILPRPAGRRLLHRVLQYL